MLGSKLLSLDISTAGFRTYPQPPLSWKRPLLRSMDRPGDWKFRATAKHSGIVWEQWESGASQQQWEQTLRVHKACWGGRRPASEDLCKFLKLDFTALRVKLWNNFKCFCSKGCVRDGECLERFLLSKSLTISTAYTSGVQSAARGPYTALWKHFGWHKGSQSGLQT